MPQTLVEKIVTRYAAPGTLEPGERAHAGDFLNIRPKHIMTHDNTSAVMSKFKTIGAANIFDPTQPVFAIDHDIQNTTPENLGKYARIEAFAREHGIDFYPAGTGISHQVMVEQGYVTPGSLVVGSDSHSNLYGAVNALGTPVVRTDAACIWATGQTWWQVPPIARVNLTGKLLPGVVGKDVIIALCGVFNHDEVLNMIVEFVGDGIACLSMDQRLSIANMTTEWGALGGVFPFDPILRDYLYGRAAYLSAKNTPRYTRDDVDRWFAEKLEPDSGAHYAVDLTLDLATVIPHVSGPDHVKVMHALPEIQKQRIKIDKAYLLSCVNARLEDLAEAAAIVEGHSVAEGVEFYVAAASAEVQRQAENDGFWQTLIDAGAIALPSGCGPCIGLGRGTLEPGEVCISATNRNFRGRMGSRDAKAYLGSPAVVAASAIAGYICSPHEYENVKPTFSIKVHDQKRNANAVEILAGFPQTMTGRSLLLPVDNLNTDGIYSGKLTYRDDVSDQEMAAAAMANYDPQFSDIAREADIIVAGRNFGTGSSREQAATCLKLRGIQCIIAASFSQTYKRNAFNNGFLVMESPELYEALLTQSSSPLPLGEGGERSESGEGSLRLQSTRPSTEETKRPSPPTPLPGGEGSKNTIPGPQITIDFAASTITMQETEYPFAPLSTVAQELIIAGGAENLVKLQLGRSINPT
ncbi:MAG: homoaconitase [Planctomycetes bacterium]|nr:homoaconitase [Planctomycetota bacterium]